MYNAFHFCFYTYGVYIQYVLYALFPVTNFYFIYSTVIQLLYLHK